MSAPAERAGNDIHIKIIPRGESPTTSPIAHRLVPHARVLGVCVTRGGHARTDVRVSHVVSGMVLLCTGDPPVS